MSNVKENAKEMGLVLLCEEEFSLLSETQLSRIAKEGDVEFPSRLVEDLTIRYKRIFRIEGLLSEEKYLGPEKLIGAYFGVIVSCLGIKRRIDRVSAPRRDMKKQINLLTSLSV